MHWFSYAVSRNRFKLKDIIEPTVHDIALARLNGSIMTCQTLTCNTYCRKKRHLERRDFFFLVLATMANMPKRTGIDDGSLVSSRKRPEKEYNNKRET
jgi:hypothetical protein